jgi:RNA-directed DNA polymerase
MPRRVARTVLRGPGRSNASRLPDGRFYKSMLYPVLRRINEHLVRWAMRKYKRLYRRERQARRLLVKASRQSPRLFAHWRFGLKPDGWTMGAV